MPVTTPLNSGKSATVSAAGTATVSIGPNQIETWNITNVAVAVSSAVSEPTARVYLGTASPNNFLGGTYSGSLDGGPENQTLQQGQSLVCVWTGADVGATATLSVSGTKTA